MNARQAVAGQVALRPIRADDVEFLYRLYASTREEELAPVPWSVEMKEAFLRQQFGAQHAYYHEQYEDADFDIIMVDGAPAGRLYLARLPEELRLVDIALLPEYRGRGLGTRLIEDVFAEARRGDKVVRIHVEHNNRARRLYQRLGFRDIGENGVYFLMEWRPNGQLKTAS